MIYFSPHGEPTVRVRKDDPFRPRLGAILRAARRDGATRWTEADNAAPPPTAQRRMLERLLLSLAAGPDAPGWVSPGVARLVSTNLSFIAPHQKSLPGRYAPRQARGLGAGAGARRLDDPAGPGRSSPGSGLAPGGPGAGAYGAGRVVLVGDRPGPGWGGRMPNWPFISGLRTGCSAWLAEQLEAAGIGEEQLYWFNAYDQDGTPTDVRSVEALPLWRTTATLTVALGRNAARWCEASGWRYAEVHHPQFWKRFHARHSYRLVSVLRRHLLT